MTLAVQGQETNRCGGIRRSCKGVVFRASTGEKGMDGLGHRPEVGFNPITSLHYIAAAILSVFSCLSHESILSVKGRWLAGSLDLSEF